jgi:predicted MFS family arabinose efflux permease
MLNVSERRVVFLVGAVQFVNVLDFTMVMPLGPDFAHALGIPTSELGKIVAGYGPAAALSGLLGSFFLDRFDRRIVLAVAMLGLVVGTLFGGLAHDLPTLTLARVIAGLFGGPATSIAYAIIADVIPPARRGKAMGAVMGAFSVAQIIGVSAAVMVSSAWGWRMPFFIVAGIGLVVTLGAIFLLPPMRLHLAKTEPKTATLRELASRPIVWISYAMTAVLMASGFILIPNLPAYLLANLHYPRNHYQYLTAVGGVASFVTLRLVGRLVDRTSSLRVTLVTVPLGLLITYVYFVRPLPLPVMLLYVSFMVALGARNVAYNALTSKVPRPFERARFLSIQSTVYHATAGLAAWFSTRLLRQLPDGTLAGIPRVAVVSMALTAVFPLLVAIVETRVSREAKADVIAKSVAPPA